MKIQTGIIFTVLLSLFLTFAGLSDAQARRFGGGSSFGGRSSYSAPYQRSAAQPTRPSNQQQAGNPSQTAKPGWANRGGLMGMLGGLAIGGLLGSMFMGGGFHGLNFLDMLIFGGIAFFLYRMFAARAGSAQRPTYGQTSGRTSNDSYQDMSSGYQQHPDQSPQNSSSGVNTDILFDKSKKTADLSDQSVQNQDADFNTAVIPKGFDEQGFLNGAKIAYKALQKAWDERDLAEIRGLTTDKVFAEIQDQIKASTEENHTEILKLNAELLEVREIGNEIEVVVLFDTILREDRDEQAGQVREVWHFIKPKSANQTKWLLDGIQQLAE
ncbi:Tim44 domain-containing protein [Methyloglobulus sp.]|uniref:Tim44 domain-containing protein n=1 Tax=Methyloglobulus sp. TaxID=2518622 RepID=UPI003988B4F9